MQANERTRVFLSSNDDNVDVDVDNDDDNDVGDGSNRGGGGGAEDDAATGATAGVMVGSVAQRAASPLAGFCALLAVIIVDGGDAGAAKTH